MTDQTRRRREIKGVLQPPIFPFADELEVLKGDRVRVGYLQNIRRRIRQVGDREAMRYRRPASSLRGRCRRRRRSLRRRDRHRRSSSLNILSRVSHSHSSGRVRPALPPSPRRVAFPRIWS